MTELERARELARGALTALESNRRRIDDLNVYPVPDGDTGTNLTLTVRAVVEQLESTTSHGISRRSRSELTRAALMGARGNSGVIFSQILRGFAEVRRRRGRSSTRRRSRARSAARATPRTAR